MKRTIFALLLLSLAIWLGLKLHADPGYVLIAYQTKTIEMPLWLLGVGILCVYLIIALLAQSLSLLLGLPQQMSRWRAARKQRKIRRYTIKGFIALAEGYWDQAEKTLLKGAQNNPAVLLNYLGAAIAAQEKGDVKQRDNYLRLAHNSTAHADTAIGLTQAKLQLSHGQFEQCLATLTHLQKSVPHHSYVLMMLKDVYIALNDWQQLLLHAERLHKEKLIDFDDYFKLKLQAYTEQFRRLSQNAVPIETSYMAWHQIPIEYRRQMSLMRLFTPELIGYKPEEAEILLRETLSLSWDSELAAWYGRIKTSHIDRQLQHAELWLKKHTDDAGLLLSLGQLCYRLKLWGKAQHYLMKSIKIKPSAQAYYVLGRVSLALSQPEEASKHFEAGLKLLE